MMRRIKSKREAGLLLGPVFYEFCCRLYWMSSNYDREKDALLFMSRGGLRLKYLYELFLEVNKFTGNIDLFPFWISRFAAVKLIFPVNPELAVSHIVREFAHTNCRVMAAALLPEKLFPEKQELLQSIPPELADAPVNRENFFSLYYCSCAYSDCLRRHFQEQAQTGNKYLSDTFGRYKVLHTVDTGWFGSTLGSLQAGCPNWRWDAIYFGRWNYRNETPWYFYDIIPVMIDANGLRGKNPMDIFLEYHHLIEAVLEPELPSTEYYLPGGACNSMISDWEGAIAGNETEEIWQGILEYFRTVPPVALSDVTGRTMRVLKTWKRVLRYPTEKEARILEVPARSADFGKEEATSIFCQGIPQSRVEYWRHIKWSLWPAGAIAVSSGKLALPRQLFWYVCRKIIDYRGAV